jgi:hypothetical protein
MFLAIFLPGFIHRETFKEFIDIKMVMKHASENIEANCCEYVCVPGENTEKCPS